MDFKSFPSPLFGFPMADNACARVETGTRIGSAVCTKDLYSMHASKVLLRREGFTLPTPDGLRAKRSKMLRRKKKLQKKESKWSNRIYWSASTSLDSKRLGISPPGDVCSVSHFSWSHHRHRRKRCRNGGEGNKHKEKWSNFLHPSHPAAGGQPSECSFAFALRFRSCGIILEKWCTFPMPCTAAAKGVSFLLISMYLSLSLSLFLTCVPAGRAYGEDQDFIWCANEMNRTVMRSLQLRKENAFWR